MSINFTDLQYFKEVSSSGALTRAAETLGVTQPALTLSMKRLEQAFGVPLLARGRRGVQLTAAGRLLQQKLERIIGDWENLRTDLRIDFSEPRGTITLACPPSLSTTYFPKFVAQIAQTMPNVSLVSEHGISQQNVESVLHGRADMAIVTNPIRHPELHIQHLSFDSLNFYAHQVDQTPIVLTQAPDIVALSPHVPQGQALLREASARLGWAPTRRYAIANLDAIASLLSTGTGVGLLPSSLARKYPLGAVIGAPQTRDEVCLIYQKSADQSGAFHGVVEAIRKTFELKG